MLRVGTSVVLGIAVIWLLMGCTNGQEVTVPTPVTAPLTTTSPGQLHPLYSELPSDHRFDVPKVTLPWSLLKVDRDLDRIYLSSSQSGCVIPKKVRVTETSTSISLAVVGSAGREPCTEQKKTLIGYIKPLAPIADRAIEGYSR